MDRQRGFVEGGQMTDNLVERLRELTCNCYDAEVIEAGKDAMDEAADRIEKLNEDVGVLIAASIRLSSRIDLDSDHYVDRIEKLEAALRKLTSTCDCWAAVEECGKARELLGAKNV